VKARENYQHQKKRDTYIVKEKVKIIEKADKHIPPFETLNSDVLIVTSDHSSHALLKSHPWHLNHFLLYSKYIIPDKVSQFTELKFGYVYLGYFRIINALPLMLAHTLKI